MADSPPHLPTTNFDVSPISQKTPTPLFWQFPSPPISPFAVTKLKPIPFLLDDIDPIPEENSCNSSFSLTVSYCDPPSLPPSPIKYPEGYKTEETIEINDLN